MKTLFFRNRFETYRFRYNNDYWLHDLIEMNLWFPPESNEFPYLVLGDNLNKERIRFANVPNQFQGRLLNSRRIIEILDGPEYPIRIKIGTMEFVAGKGFLARYNSKFDLDLLFVAAINNKEKILKAVSDIKEVKFYISKDIYKEEYKSKILVIMKEIMAGHTGDLVITNDIRNYLGGKIVIPPIQSLSGKKAFANQVVEHCFTVLQGGKKEEVNPMKPMEVTENEITDIANF